MDAIQRLTWYEVAPDGAKALFGVHHYILSGGALPEELIHLVFLRVSQINGSAYCLGLHAKALRAAGEPDARIDQVGGWQVSDQYTDKERAALAWADAVTHINIGRSVCRTQAAFHRC